MRATEALKASTTGIITLRGKEAALYLGKESLRWCNPLNGADWISLEDVCSDQWQPVNKDKCTVCYYIEVLRANQARNGERLTILMIEHLSDLHCTCK